MINILKYLLIFCNFLGYSQTVHIITPTSSGTTNFRNGIEATVNAGDTVRVNPDSDWLVNGELFVKDLVGTSSDHIIFDIIQDTLNANSATNVIDFKDCEFLDIIADARTGNVGDSIGNRIVITNSSSLGIDDRSSKGMTYTRINAYNIDASCFRGGFAGTDGSPETYRKEDQLYEDIYRKYYYCSAFKCGNGGEGFYIGESQQRAWFKDGNGQLYQNPRLDTVIIIGCTADSIYRDGIQWGGANWSIVRNNTVTRVGYGQENSHSNGYQLGEGSNGLFYNNIAYKGLNRSDGAGIQSLGNTVRIFNNVTLDFVRGLHLFDRVVKPNGTGYVYNNTFLDCEESGVYNASGNKRRTEIINNILHINNSVGGDNQFIREGNDSFCRQIDNNNVEVIGSTGYNTLNIADTSNYNFSTFTGFDFSLLTGSSAIDQGENLYLYNQNLNIQLNGDSRPINGSWNSGAN